MSERGTRRQTRGQETIPVDQIEGDEGPWTEQYIKDEDGNVLMDKAYIRRR